MKKCKILVSSTLAAAAVVAIVLCKNSSDEKKDKDAVGARGLIAEAVPSAASVSAPANAIAAAATKQTPTVRGTLPYVLVSKEPFGKPLRIAAEALGAKAVCVVSRNAILVEADEATRTRISADSRFEEMTEFVPSSKIQPALAALISGGAQSVDVSLVALSAEDRQRVIACLKQGGGEMLEGCINEGNTIRAKLPAALVADLAARGDVRWMERFVRPMISNDQAVLPEAMSVTNVWDGSRGIPLTGLGQIITTSDSGIDTGDPETLHLDLRNRVKGLYVATGCDKYDGNGHGTHTAGSIVGDGTATNGVIRGTAYEADLYAWFCGRNGGSAIYTPEHASELFRPQGVEAYIHSASWGSSVSGEYTAMCVDYDTYTWENPEYLPVFSAGNDGENGRTTIGSPGSAKNVLTVGATGNRPKQDPATTAYFSSRGPCTDGRTKPDISAPGHAVTSTRSCMDGGSVTNGYTSMSGTSMACPLTAGAVALVRQWLVEQKGFADEDGKRPTAALMKAAIMGGAKGATTPNNDQGWGRVDLADTLFPTNGCAVKLVDRIPFAQGFVTNIVVETTNAAPLDVQLVWVDYPGDSAGSQATPKLVNDLDLTVMARIPGEPTVRYGNGGDEPDALNNAESVRITSASPAKYVITVTCKNIPYDYTEGGAAALYIRGAFDPGAEVEMPAYVHLKKQNRGFISLDRALEAVKDDGEIVEILDWVNFDAPVTLTNTCTIAATNDNAAADHVVRKGDAALTVADGATVTLSNVVFTASSETLVEVEGGSCLKLDDGVDLGVDYDHVSITTEDAAGFELAGPLLRKILFHCDAATKTNEVFGSYSCDAETATNSAVMIVCVDDVDHETRGGVGQGGRLVWKHVNVPIDEAVAYFVSGDGKTNTYVRMAKALDEFKVGYDEGRLTNFIVRANGAFGLSFDVTHPLAICGEGDVQPVLTASSTSGFSVKDGGALTLTNIVFCGYSAPKTTGGGFIAVDGGALTLENGATLDGMEGRVYWGSGIVDLKKGVVTMREGASIINCRAWGASTSSSGYGGAIYAYCSTNCTLNLEGGVISNCWAQTYGGGVCVDYSKKSGSAAVNLSGELTIFGNRSDNNAADDIYIYNANAISNLTLKGALNGTVGIRYSSNNSGLGNHEGEAFITYADGIEAKALENSAACFVSDVDFAFYGVVGKNKRLVWKKPTDDGTCSPHTASAHVYYPNGDVAHYTNLVTAIAHMANGTTARIEMCRGAKESPNKNLNLYDTIRTPIVLPEYCDLTLTAGEAGYRVRRWYSTGITVPAGTSLTITNMVMDRRSAGPGDVTNAFIRVTGGELTLADGACISNILGNASRGAGAIVVRDGGTITMESGSRIVDCQNCYNYKIDFGTSKNYGCGGGILLDNGIARLRGGEISNCLATRAGGVYVCNGSEVYVSGDMKISDNKWLDADGKQHRGNVFVADQATMYLDGVLSKKIGTRGLPWMTKDTNVVAEVSYAWTGDVDALAKSATNFVHDVNRNVGVAVTNGTEALVVWCGAVKDGVFTASDNKVYALVGEMPVISPELLPELDDAGKIAGELGKLADATVAAKITTLEGYNDFCQWASKVLGGKEAVAESDKAYVSYEFGTTNLFVNTPAVEITEIAGIDGGLTLSVVVKDGNDVMAVASASVAKLFEGTSDVGDWVSEEKKLDLTAEGAMTDLTCATEKKVEFAIKPVGTPSRAFIRLRY